MKTNKEIKVVVTFNAGYEARFTKACLNILRKREDKNHEYGCNNNSRLS